MTASGPNEGKLYVQVARAIREMVESGRLHAGDKLPTLAALAEQFACSRATVREALAALRGQGLIELRHGNGAYVRTVGVEMWMEPLEFAILLGTGQVRDLVELLTAVLSGVASFAAARINELNLAPVQAALFEVECAGPVGEDSVSAEMGFYLALVECHGNRVLADTLRVLQEALRSALRFARDHDLSGSAACHAVFDAVSAGDAKAARDAVYAYGEALTRRLEPMADPG